VNSSLAFTGWFNVSQQETWGFDLSFRKSDHKAVKRLERPRLENLRRSIEVTYYLIITIACEEIARPALKYARRGLL